jgi:hypothetical protein
MWYKTAKQGSVWSRLGPDAEAQFDELIKQATKRSGLKKRYVDLVLFDKLFRKSNFKNLVLRFILRERFDEEDYGHFQVSMFDKIEKLAAFDKFIPTIFANKIRINKAIFNGKLSYYAQISLLKHEFAHAITSHTIENTKIEPYLQPYKYTRSQLGQTPKQTKLIMLKTLMKKHWSSIWPYITQVDPNLEFTLYDEKMPLDENLQKINDAWFKFNVRVDDKIIKVPKEVREKINEINSQYDISDLIGFGNLTKQQGQQRLDLYRKRGETLGSDNVDLYYANPEETRAHIIEMQYLFSIPLLKEYYEHLLILKKYNKENSKQQFLEDIKKMFNIFMGTTYNDIYSGADWVNENYSPQKYAEYFGLDSTYYKFLYKANDKKFRQQVAKHLGNVYQELKQEFNTTEPEINLP